MSVRTAEEYTGLSRRTLMKASLTLSAAAAMSGSLPFRASALIMESEPSHGLAVFDDLKYPADFSHFSYVNQEAPKGGSFIFSANDWTYNQSPNTFNTLNSFSSKGDAPPRMELCFDSLMVRSNDEPDAVYGLIAQDVAAAEDGKSYVFNLNPSARFHDGTPLTAEDVAFSYQLLRAQGHPAIQLLLHSLFDAKAENDYRLRLTLTGENPKQNRRAILDMVQLPVFSQRYYQNNTFEKNTLEAPLSSGAYKVGARTAGQFITYQRVEDYWAKDHPTQRGLNNFDQIRIEFFRDAQPAFEAFKKGDLHWRSENISKTWATEYNFEAIRTGKVIKAPEPAFQMPTLQGWALNQRRERFKDSRVREAIALCFDFEWSNKNLFYGLYERLQSCFSNSPYMATGKPGAEEEAIINRHAQLLDAPLKQALLEAPVTMTVNDGTGRNREQLRRAASLMKDAGFDRKGDWLTDKNGKVFQLEILNNSENFNRIYNPMIKNLRAIGINATIRMAEAANYQARLQNFDFDMMGAAMRFSPTPTSETLRNFFGSDSAELSGSWNFPGIHDPLVDALINDINNANSRADLTDIMRVLDRLLRYRRDWIPNWTSPAQLISYWDRFGQAAPRQAYGDSPETNWWLDKEKAAKIGKA